MMVQGQDPGPGVSGSKPREGDQHDHGNCELCDALERLLAEAQGKLDAVEEWNKSFGGTVLYEHLARILKGE